MTDPIEELNENLAPASGMHKAAIVVFVFSTMISALEASGSGLFPGVAFGGWASLSAICGAVSVAMYSVSLRYPLLGLIPGAIMGLMSFFALHYYAHARNSVYNPELAVVGAVASVPGALIYYTILRKMATSGPRS